MNPFAIPIEIVRPDIVFGSGVAPEVGGRAQAMGAARILVVADAFNASYLTENCCRGIDSSCRASKSGPVRRSARGKSKLLA